MRFWLDLGVKHLHVVRYNIPGAFPFGGPALSSTTQVAEVSKNIDRRDLHQANSLSTWNTSLIFLTVTQAKQCFQHQFQ